MCGRVNLQLGFYISCSKICVWVTVLGLKMFLIFVILFMKWLLAMFAICFSDVVTMLLWIIFLGGVFVHVLVNYLTVVQSLLILLTSGLMSGLDALLLLLLWYSWLVLLLFVLFCVLVLSLIVSFCEKYLDFVSFTKLLYLFLTFLKILRVGRFCFIMCFVFVFS